MKSLTVYLSAIAFLVISVITVYGAEDVKVDAKALFEQKCSRCHDLDKPESKRRTAQQWEYSVGEMRFRDGTITDEEAKIIIDYLIKNYGP
ncbi:MAG: hypothetical protein A2Z09_06290 [Nitrospirae bacterium RBG_16_43_8]|nr:MAG: hypothetical protein A2Z09_06290 [Nitrospirae bacterium RBG_16_43_8]